MTQSVALGIMLAYNQYKQKKRLLESNKLVGGTTVANTAFTNMNLLGKHEASLNNNASATISSDYTNTMTLNGISRRVVMSSLNNGS